MVADKQVRTKGAGRRIVQVQARVGTDGLQEQVKVRWVSNR